MKAWKIILVVLLVAAAAALGYRFYPRNNSKAVSIPASQIVEVKRGSIQTLVSTTGTISMPRQVKLTFGSSGTVAEVKVKLGDRVKEKDILAKLDISVLERAVAQAEANLKTAQLNIEKELSRYTPADIAQAEALVVSAKANLAQAEDALKDAKAPYTAADIAKAQAVVESAKATLAQAEDALKTTTLDRASAQAAVDNARANLAKAEADLSASILDRPSAQAAADNARANLANAQANLDTSALERASAEAALEQAKQNLENLQKRAPLDIWAAENEERKAADNFWASFSQAAAIREAAGPLEVAWRAWQRAKLQLVVANQSIANAITDAQNALARAQDNLNKLMPGGSTIAQREAALAAAKAALAKAEDDLSRLLPGGVTIQQREAALAAAKAALAKAEEELADMKPDPVVVQQKESQVAAAKATLIKMEEELAKKKVGPDPLDLHLMKVQLDKAQISLADAKEQLEKAVIRAPFSGTVADVPIKTGDTVGASTVAMTLIDTETLEVEVTVDEVDVAQLRLGQETILTFDAISGLTLSGKVAAVSPVGKVQSGVVSYTAIIALEPPSGRGGAPGAVPDSRQGSGMMGMPERTAPGKSPGGSTGAKQPSAATPAPTAPAPGGTPAPSGTPGPVAREMPLLRGGMTALAEVVIQKREDVLLVSSRAIRTKGRERTVQVLVGANTETRTVRTGISDGQQTEIIEGLVEGEKVVLPAPRTAPTAQGGLTPGKQIAPGSQGRLGM